MSYNTVVSTALTPRPVCCLAVFVATIWRHLRGKSPAAAIPCSPVRRVPFRPRIEERRVGGSLGRRQTLYLGSHLPVWRDSALGCDAAPRCGLSVRSLSAVCRGSVRVCHSHSLSVFVRSSRHPIEDGYCELLTPVIRPSVIRR